MNITKNLDYTYIIFDDTYGVPTFNVKGVGTHPESSVLAGQDRVVFLDAYPTIEQAREAYPDAQLSHKLLEPQNTYDHLEGEEL